MNLLSIIARAIKHETEGRPRPLPKIALVVLTIGYYANEHFAVRYGIDLTPGLLVAAITIGWLAEPPSR